MYLLLLDVQFSFRIKTTQTSCTAARNESSKTVTKRTLNPSNQPKQTNMAKQGSSTVRHLTPPLFKPCRSIANKPLQSEVCLYFLAVFLPPLAVFFRRGCNADFLINIGLSILGWIPGVLRTSSPFPSYPLSLLLEVPEAS
jgi:uncharacterized membrane protein YqaE (UPF0057 family)